MFEKIRAEYRSTIKSYDTEEHIDLLFFRPVGFLWACFFRKIHVTPNVVTIASIFIGIAGGLCFYPTNVWVNLGGILLLILAGTLDCADGQLARLTHQQSKIGRILDGVAGDFWFIAIYTAICLRTNETVGFFEKHHWIIWTLAAVNGVCHMVQAAIADRYRQLHLFFIKGAKGSELDSSIEIARNYLSLTWENNFFSKLLQFVYFRYTVTQERLTPQMQKLRLNIRHSFENNEMPKPLAEEFRKLSLPLCKWENFMTYNWRAVFMYICVLVGYPWVYILIELTLFNGVLVYSVCKHEAICRIMNQRLTEYCNTHQA